MLDYVRLEHSDLLSSFQLEHWCYRVAWGYFLLNNLQNQLDNQMIKLQLYKPYMHTVEKTFDPYCQVSEFFLIFYFEFLKKVVFLSVLIYYFFYIERDV